MENLLNEPKAIETIHKGFRFRSRLEARWAEFFDICKAEWEFEPEGYDLPNGMKYLPDFLIHNVRIRPDKKIDVYFEVKGVFDETDYTKISQFYGGKWDEFGYRVHEIRRPIIVVGNIPKGEDIQKDMFDQYTKSVCQGLFSFAFLDGDEWPAYPCITESGDFGIVKDLWQRDLPPHMDVPKTEEAYRIARSYRFEFEEKDLAPLEKEVEVLRRRAELEEEKRELIKKIQGGN